MELKQVILRNYYAAPAVTGEHLDPEELAEELALAYTALRKVVKPPHDSTVFFGKPVNSHKVMQDAFLIGCLQRISRVGAPDSWLDLFKNLKLHETDWDFWGGPRPGEETRVTPLAKLLNRS